MPQMIFVNLPVKDLDKSVTFFKALGFSFNPQFTDETATCMVISDTIFAMLLTHEKFASFSPKPITDTNRSIEVLTCLSRDSREAVDAMVKAAVAAGGSTYKAPQDYGFMYGHGFLDLDGHVWELMWMDPGAVEPQT
jgi:predicted lactoylglutathione lyase